MALLEHVSAEMSLRYGRLFDATVRADYEKALTLAKTRLGPVLPGRTQLPIAEITGGKSDWQQAPLNTHRPRRPDRPANATPSKPSPPTSAATKNNSAA